jgi:hypothetical protein
MVVCLAFLQMKVKGVASHYVCLADAVELDTLYLPNTSVHNNHMCAISRQFLSVQGAPATP